MLKYKKIISAIHCSFERTAEIFNFHNTQILMDFDACYESMMMVLFHFYNHQFTFAWRKGEGKIVKIME